MPKHIKPLKSKDTYKQKLQYDVEKAIKPEKIQPKKIFDGFKEKQIPKKKRKNK
jgi:hypothetical protein